MLGDVVAALGELQRRHQREERALGARERSSGMPVTRGSSDSTRFTLAQGPSILIAAHRLAELGRQVRRLDEAEERALRVGVRQHEAGRDLACRPRGRRRGRGHRARRCARPRAEVRISTPKPRAARRHGLGDRAHAADHVAVEALLVVVAAGEQVEQEAERGARLVGPAVLAVDVVREEQRLDLLGLVVAVEEVARGCRSGTRPSAAISSPLMPRKRRPTRSASSRPPRPRRVDVRRRLQEERLEVARQLLELRRRCGRRSGRPRPRGAPALGTVRAAIRPPGELAVPSGNGTKSAGSQGTMRSPWRARPRSRITSGRSMLAM